MSVQPDATCIVCSLSHWLFPFSLCRGWGPRTGLQYFSFLNSQTVSSRPRREYVRLPRLPFFFFFFFSSQGCMKKCPPRWSVVETGYGRGKKKKGQASDGLLWTELLLSCSFFLLSRFNHISIEPEKDTTRTQHVFIICKGLLWSTLPLSNCCCHHRGPSSWCEVQTLVRPEEAGSFFKGISSPPHTHTHTWTWAVWPRFKKSYPQILLWTTWWRFQLPFRPRGLSAILLGSADVFVLNSTPNSHVASPFHLMSASIPPLPENCFFSFLFYITLII